jgi:putative oxidoreductase
MNADALNAWAPQARAVLRIVTALLFLQHGIMKLTGFPMEMPGGGEGGGLPPLILIASWMEVVGSILLIVGLFTRPVAFLLSGEMAVAYFMAHAPQSVYPIVNQGEVAILFCFIFLYLVFAGGGAWSVDRSMRGGD